MVAQLLLLRFSTLCDVCDTPHAFSAHEVFANMHLLKVVL